MATTTAETLGELPSSDTGSNWLQWGYIIALVYLLLVAVSLIGSGFKIAAGDQAKELFSFASNPITGLVRNVNETT